MVTYPFSMKTRRLRSIFPVAASLTVLTMLMAPAQGATFNVSNQAELFDAIELAQASGDPSSTINLTSSFTVTGTVPDVAGKDIAVVTGGNTLTLTTPAFNVDGGASLTLSGNVVADGSAVSKAGAGQLLLNGSRLHLGEGTTQITGGDVEFGTSVGGTVFQMAIADGDNTTASLVVSGTDTRLAATGSDGLKLGGGQNSVATLTVGDGARFESDQGFTVSGYSTTTVNLNVSGSGSAIDGSGLLARAGTVNVAIEDGAQWLAGASNLYLGGIPFGSVGRGLDGAQVFATVSGTDTEWRTTGRLFMMNGSLDILDGASVSAGDVQIASGRGTLNADVTVSGSGSTFSGTTMDIGAGSATGAGSLTIADGGEVSVGGGAAALDIGSRGTLNFGGADIAAGAGTLDASGITLDADGVVNFNHTDTDYAFDVGVTGDGTLNHLAGHTIMTDDQTGFTGTANVSGGTLSVNGTLGGVLNVLTEGRLQGSGVVGVTENAGIIAPGNSIGTLTVAGDYTGSGGLLEIESVLGDDSSATDLLHVTGNTSGSTNVEVINLGGSGALTNEGIRIVQVDGTSDGAFGLLGDYEFEGDQAVVGGAYAYRLYQGSISDPADGDWYLRSALLPPDPADPEPSEPLYQPGVPVYQAYAGALGAFTELDTLQQRKGNRHWSEADPQEDTGLWVQMQAGRHSLSPETTAVDVAYDASVWGLRAGLDAPVGSFDDGELIVEASLEYGRLVSAVTSRFGDGTISSGGLSLGGALTWYGDNGFYLDGQGQVTWSSSDLTSTTAARELVGSNNGFGYAVGLELGHRIDLDEEWSITPQAQLTYTSVSFDEFTDTFGAPVSLENSHDLVGRVGLSVDHQREWENEEGTTDRSHVYGIANLYVPIRSNATVDVAGVDFGASESDAWGGIGLGGTLNFDDDRTALHGEITARTNLEQFGTDYALTGSVGLRVKF
ncbi:autotransporter family protein [Pelagibacterium xiamenense]|uniref:autotransporter family protein n=1 Tax=Pelagibacterium xiamenense TaxID=2901140 RepID=UPI001E5169CE|nr:autotransporter outer membrane beta-barrel domain-containing protein [Pelagibacterium xiamenense]MCD7060529.1 autotransporter outer membrane beta-barrel domain-containing protein [Pelagibacterium xiamenense]